MQKLNFLNNIRPIISKDQIRIGRNQDGGYVVNSRAIFNSKLISLGISDDWSFEESYEKITKQPISMYDGSVSSIIFFYNLRDCVFEIFSLLFFLKCFKRPFYLKNKFLSIIKNYKTYINFKLFTKKRLITFYQDYVSNLEKTIRIDELMLRVDKYENIFFKIDIEGHEYRIISDLMKFNS